MRKNSAWIVLAIVGMMMIGAFSAALTAPDPVTGICASGNKVIKGGADLLTDASSTWTDVCVPDANLVADCYVYKKSDGSCWCDSTGSFSSITISPPARQTKPTLGCVPIIQRVLYGVCTRTGQKQYDCQCTNSGRTTKVDLATLASGNTRNTLNLAKGCSNFDIPNCKNYNLALGSGSEDDFLCNECNTGATVFSTTTGTSLVYDSGRSLSGKGCPIDGTWQPNTCKAMTLSSGSYMCSCTSGTSERVVFATSLNQKISQGCAVTANFASKDTNCNSFNYAATDSAITCYACATGYTLINFDGDAASETFTQCISSTGSFVSGCKKYHADDRGDTSNRKCIQCNTDYDSAPTGSSALTVLAGSNTYQKLCLPKGRWSISTTLCTSYTAPVGTSVYLACATCAGTQTGKNVRPPCYLSNNALANRFTITGCSNIPATNDVGGFVVKKSDDTGACIVSGIIQNCEKYSAVSAGGVGSGGCLVCDLQYTLVDNQISKPTATSSSTAASKICIPNSFLDPNDLCDAYSNLDFTCYRCKNGLSYDKNLKRCALPTDASSGCDSAYTSGGKIYCKSCQIGYTMIYSVTGGTGTCVSAVQKCAILSAAGCSLCVNGYQLVSPTNCVKLPPNCQKVNDKGVCTLCRLGFATDSQGQCARTNQNTCPAGQVPTNGVCAPVQVTIPDCILYTVDSKCSQCIEGKTPSSDGLSCVSSDRPGAKPCPPSTNSVIYRRNPSDPLGDCVAVDVKCDNSRDDGFCISCKDNEYAHSDGKCYRIITIPVGGI